MWSLVEEATKWPTPGAPHRHHLHGHHQSLRLLLVASRVVPAAAGMLPVISGVVPAAAGMLPVASGVVPATAGMLPVFPDWCRRP